MKRLYVFLFLIFSVSLVKAQENRTFNAYGNNIDNPEWGAKDYFFQTLTTMTYGDSISSVTGQNRPNARLISNFICDQKENIEDDLQLTDYNWVFGQFVDHDITLVGVDYSERIFVDVPQGDKSFTPGSKIPIFRTVAAPGTGTDRQNPRRFNNEITSFLDASNIYGSDKKRADWLRTFKDGKLRTSEGNLLPWNTLTGEFNSKIDPNAPDLANDTHISDKLYVSGDVRACENPLLTSLHTLFMREHNRLCDVIKEKNPGWNDEQIYQKARKLVSAYFQSIVYNEWLPMQGVKLPAYKGYNPEINPTVSNLFSAAAFRLGHSQLNKIITRIDDNGKEMIDGNISLRDAYFNPLLIKITGGIEPFLKGMSVQLEQKIDVKVVDEVRNYLFGKPDLGGLDLATINIMRSRERGLPDYNTIRADFGLEKIKDFNEITRDSKLANDLKFLYGNVDNIDAWIGLLAEDHVRNTIFGETLLKILEDQFIRLRDGDRFYFENDPAFSKEELNDIRNTKIHDIIMRNSDLSIMPYEVFTTRRDVEIGGPSITYRQLKAIPYPNPVSSSFIVKVWVEDESTVDIKLYDINGIKIVDKKQNLIEGENFLDEIDLSNFPKGIYNLNLKLGNTTNTLKIIKQ